MFRFVVVPVGVVVGHRGRGRPLPGRALGTVGRGRAAAAAAEVADLPHDAGEAGGAALLGSARYLCKSHKTSEFGHPQEVDISDLRSSLEMVSLASLLSACHFFGRCLSLLFILPLVVVQVGMGQPTVFPAMEFVTGLPANKMKEIL